MSKQAFPAFDGGAALRDLAEAFTAFGVSQRARLIAVSSPHAGSLIAERFVGTESISEPYAFDIDCLSNDAYLDIGALLGEPVTLRLLLADGTRTRTWHGLITEASQLGADGALARYRLRSEPWLALLGHRRTSRIFQDKTVEEILGEVFAHYPAARFSFRLNAALPPRSLCVQYRETDLAFVQRLLASVGLSYSFEHDQDAASEGGGTGDEQPHTQHELVIFDAREPVPVCAQAEIRYHRANATEASDSIQSWRLRQTVTSNAVTLASWDYKQLAATHAEAALDAEPLGGLGEVPVLEDYAGDGAYRFPNGEHAEHVTDHHAADHALQAQRFLAEGTVRQLAPFTRFSLLQHALLEGDASDFTVLSVRHEAANNLNMGVEHTRLPGDLENGSYRNQAECVAAAQVIVPRPLGKPRMPGLQTAIVVGTQDASDRLGTSSERDHRVKVQFPWQRGGAPLSESMASEDERATRDETNGTWLRVASMLAGPNWGGAFVPRVGAEVLVDFIDGDPDRPLVVAQLYNGEDAPPWPAGEDSGANHAGAVSGIHAPTLDGTGWSQWQIDDTQGQSRSRVATSFASSQLELGHLISHGPTGGQRGAWRGEGFELRTAGWSVARAPKGLLLSGSARSSATSTQMDAQQAAGQLKGAAQLVQHLTDAAAQSKAKPPARTDVLDQFAQRIQPELPPPDGTDATDRALKPFEAPALLMEAPANIALTTPHSTTVFAGQHLVASVQEDLHLAAQHTASFIAAKTKSLYTHAGGITAISANDPLSLRAHDDKLEVLADQSVTLTSSSDEVHVLAQSKIVLQAGQSSVTLEGGNIIFACPGNFTVKGASKVLAGGGSAAAALRALPQAQGYVTAAEKDGPPSLVGRPALVATEVRAISLDSPLDDGSANDGSGTNTQKGMVFGHTYAFSVKSYTNNAPSDLGTIKWKLRHTSPASSKNTQVEKSLVATGDKVEITIRDRDMCGCDVAIIAYIEDPDGGGSLTLFQHNRYRWFDSKKNDKQVEVRKAAPWRIDQGQTSLCGMAALYYVMVKRNPDAYAKLAKELLRTGEFETNGYIVRPNHSSAEKMYETNPSLPEFTRLRMPEVDWLVLATSRSGESNFGYDGMENGALDRLKAVNWPSMLRPMLKGVAGFSDVASEGLSLASLPVKKSSLGKFHDWASDSDLEDLVEIDRKYNEGQQILLMVDFDLVGGEASYMTNELATDSHWVVYEGGLWFSDSNGRPTTHLPSVSTAHFKVYTWGTDPTSGVAIPLPDEVPVQFARTTSFRTNGVPVSSWKSNYYGYFAVR